MDAAEPPRCGNQVLTAPPRGDPEPSLLCSCAAGLIHMHDCPLTAGLSCVHFRPAAEHPNETVDLRRFDQMHDALMRDFLTRVYYHRIRGLAPEGDPWARRRDEREEEYAAGDDTPLKEPMADDDYEKERERLLEQRRRREEARREREARTREEKAKERARMGIKTVVEKAREAVEGRGNVASSVVDDVKLPGGDRKRRRRRRRKPDQGGGASAAPKKGETAPEGQPRRRRRRRRRRRKPEGGSSA